MLSINTKAVMVFLMSSDVSMALGFFSPITHYEVLVGVLHARCSFDSAMLSSLTKIPKRFRNSKIKGFMLIM